MDIHKALLEIGCQSDHPTRSCLNRDLPTSEPICVRCTALAALDKPYRMTREQLISYMRYQLEAENSLENAHTYSLLVRLIEKAEAKHIITPQIT